MALQMLILKQLVVRNALMILGILLSVGCSAQMHSDEEQISPEQLREDFDVVWSSLQDYHPGLYDFTSKAQFDSIANQFYQSLSDSLTEAEFHVSLRRFTKHVKCGHTAVLPSKEWYEEMIPIQKKVPVHVFLWEDQMYLDKVFGDSSLEYRGSRLISINGNSAEEIVKEVKSTIGRDGVGENLVNRNFEALFQTYYTFLYGMSDRYEMTLEKTDGSIVDVSFEGSPVYRYNKHKRLELNDPLKINNLLFGMLDDSSRIAALDFNSFSSKGYRKFYRQMFKRLSKIDSARLVIDLRGNGGGYFPHGNELLSYLMKEKFTMDFSRPKNKVKRNKFIRMKFSSKFSRFIFSMLPDRNKDDVDRNYRVRFKPKKRNHFDGEIVVLVDGWTFSTASFVASKLKNGANASIIGEESGGGAVGFNAVLKWNLTLPNSKVRMVIPAYHVDVQPEMEDLGAGVLPNVPVQYNLEQRIMKRTDLEIRHILLGF